MKTSIPGIFSSKKFMAAFVAAAFLAFGQFFPALAEHGDAIRALAAINWELVARPIYIAIGAQGIADIGKEREKIIGGLKTTFTTGAAGSKAYKEKKLERE